jgi:hypothetical protein
MSLNIPYYHTAKVLTGNLLIACLSHMQARKSVGEGLIALSHYSRITLSWGLDVLWKSLEIVSEFFKLCVRHVYCQAAATNTISFDPTHSPLRDATHRLTTLRLCPVSTASTTYIDWGRFLLHSVAENSGWSSHQAVHWCSGGTVRTDGNPVQ